MSLSTTIASSIASAFTALGDIPKQVVISRLVTGEYDTLLGSFESSSVDLTIDKAIVTSYSDSELSENLLATDSKVIIKQSDITSSFSTSDSVSIDNVTYKIVNIEQDPVNSIWIIQVRNT